MQLYIHDRVASITRPVRELKGFRRCHLRRRQHGSASSSRATIWNSSVPTTRGLRSWRLRRLDRAVIGSGQAGTVQAGERWRRMNAIRRAHHHCAMSSRNGLSISIRRCCSCRTPCRRSSLALAIRDGHATASCVVARTGRQRHAQSSVLLTSGHRQHTECSGQVAHPDAFAAQPCPCVHSAAVSPFAITPLSRGTSADATGSNSSTETPQSAVRGWLASRR